MTRLDVGGTRPFQGTGTGIVADDDSRITIQATRLAGIEDRL
jgi:hypothetical protein